MRRGLCRVLVRKPEGRNHLEDPHIDGRVVLSWIFGIGASQGHDKNLVFTILFLCHLNLTVQFWHPFKISLGIQLSHVINQV